MNLKPLVQPSSNTTKSLSFYIVLLIARVLLGGLMLEAGINKLISGTFSISGYLANGTGPFAQWFATLIPSSPVLNSVVISGEIIIGIALIFGLLLRLASLLGAIMMLLYYLPYLPPSQGWINQQIIYMAVFIVLMFAGIGYFLGVDIITQKYEKRKSIIRFLFG